METEKKTKPFKARLPELISLATALAVLAMFVCWLASNSDHSAHGIAAAAICVALFELGLVLAVPRAIRYFRGDAEVPQTDLIGERSKQRRRLHPWIGVFLTVLVSRIVLILLAYAISNIFTGYRGTLFQTMKGIWFKADTDVIHYASIAENWYSTEFPNAWTLVFLPLYPIFVHAMNWITGSSFVSGMLLNLLFSSAAGVLIYELALCDLSRRSSRFAVFCAFALPAAIFYTAPMSESLFVLLTAGALLAVRKKRFIIAGVLGALASFTRSLGIVLLVPYAAEAVRYWVLVHKRKGEDPENGENIKHSLPKAIAVTVIGGLIMCLGTFSYLLINKLLWGDWFKFMELQKQNWYQSMGFFFNTACYQTEYLVNCFESADLKTAFGLWLPNLLFIFGSLAVFLATARELRTSYVLYFAAYFAVAIGATWLLSAPRYLTALVVLPIALAKLCEARDDGAGLARAKWKQGVVAVLLLGGQLVYLALFVLKYKLY